MISIFGRRPEHARARLALVALILLVGIGGCTTYLAPPVADAQSAPELYQPPLDAEYHIALGDQLAIRSYHDARLNQDVRVRPDGRISVLLIGELKVAGLTPDALTKMISDEYRRQVSAPDLTVIVQQSVDATVYVGGEVKTPVAVPLSGSLSLLQALTSAGGWLATADMSQVLVLRRNEAGNLIASKVDVTTALHANRPDLYLRHHDIVYVPKLGVAIAGDYVELYINRLVPRSILFQFGFIKSLSDATTNVTLPVITPTP